MTEQEIFDAALRCYPNDKLGSIASFINGAMFVKNSMDASSGKSEVSDSYSPNYVSFYMAKHLAAAGFSQPSRLAGQYWYLNNSVYKGVLCCAIGKASLVSLNQEPVMQFVPDNVQFQAEFIFAPTAHDIQKEFQKRFGRRLNVSYNDYGDGIWFADEPTERLIGDNSYAISAEDKNPANAAAKCFLSNTRKRGS